MDEKSLLAALKAVYASVAYPSCDRCNTQFAIDGKTAILIRTAIAKATKDKS